MSSEIDGNPLANYYVDRHDGAIVVMLQIRIKNFRELHSIAGAIEKRVKWLQSPAGKEVVFQYISRHDYINGMMRLKKIFSLAAQQLEEGLKNENL